MRTPEKGPLPSASGLFNLRPQPPPLFPILPRQYLSEVETPVLTDSRVFGATPNLLFHMSQSTTSTDSSSFDIISDPSHAQVIGILGSNITLQFTFNVSITENSQIGIYTTDEKKIDDFKSGKSSFDIYPQKNSVFYHITNLTLSHSNTYWASLLGVIPIKSNEVQLFIEEKNTHSTATETPAEPPQYNSNAIITVIRVFAFITSLALVVGVCKIYHLKCIKSRN
ncbi:uncharacterized protein LOC116320210 isoform X2 [Oreochromis aureus]|uniref:uncharacterized protein LOC116320210 isoform X2 n=1 Tax=Oreochromis aureus TaxID=47969 RepID=UPI001954EA02|nr:uncharacterized protein LOC116320210 isoform X2 [Oreochromis aureus]